MSSTGSDSSGERRRRLVRSIERRWQRVAWCRPHRVQKTSSVFIGKTRKIEKARDVIHVEQVNLFRPPSETHRDDRNAREMWIAFPRSQRNGRQQVVLTEHDVGTLLAGRVDGVGDPHDAGGLDA